MIYDPYDGNGRQKPEKSKHFSEGFFFLGASLEIYIEIIIKICKPGNYNYNLKAWNYNLKL